MRTLFLSNLHSSDEEIDFNAVNSKNALHTTKDYCSNNKKKSDVEDKDGREVEDLSNEKNPSSRISWDSIPIIKNSRSFTTIGSSATISTLRHFGLSNHPGKGVNDVTIDAFMDLNSKASKSKDTVKLNQILRPMEVDPKQAALHYTALSCIAKRDYDQFLSIIDKNPEILLFKCRRKGSMKENNGRSSERNRTNGCNGGTLLHVLVSQKQSMKKKRLKKINKMRNRINNALAFAHSIDYEINIMPSVPDSVLEYVIEKEPKALQMVDDYGRLPLHCAIISQSMHFDDICKLQGYNDQGNDSPPKKLRVIIREISIVDLLIQYNKKGARSIDSRGNLPIHYAMSICSLYPESCEVCFQKNKKYKSPSALETVTVLLEAYPKSVGIQNKDGDLPIHVLCSMGADMNVLTLKKMLSSHSACKEMLSIKNGDGDSPLFVAVKSRASVEAINCFASAKNSTSESVKLFAERDACNNNILHVALQFSTNIDYDIIRAIIAAAPSTASAPDSKGTMPIRYATALGLPNDIIRAMLARDMPIKIGMDSKKHNNDEDGVGLARHVVGRSHHHSWWYIMIECNDEYISMIKSFLSEEATHAQIITLARQVGPDGFSELINCVSNKCRLVFHELLRFYDRYEILLSSKDSKENGVQTFFALDHGLKTNVPSDEREIEITSSVLSLQSDHSISTAVRVNNNKKDEAAVEVCLISKEKSKVLLRCYQHEEAFYAEIKVREKFDFNRQYFEEMYNYHRDESYTYLTQSKKEKLHCITFERPDHTLAEVFESVSSAGSRSQKWIEKCWIVLKQLATALKFLHSQNLIHGHLHSAHVAKYGNIWKLQKLGTVSSIGSPVRGKFRPCVPPESVVDASSLTHSNRIKSKKQSKIKFSLSVDDDSKSRKTTKERYGDTLSTLKTPSDKLEGKERNDFRSFFGFTVNESTPVHKRNNDDALSPIVQPSTNQYYEATFVPESIVASPQWDMWGFGLIMVQILLGRCMHLPNFEQAEDAILKKLCTYNDFTLGRIYHQVNHIAGCDAADLVLLLLQKDPTRRPKSFEEILAHKYFQVLTIYV